MCERNVNRVLEHSILGSLSIKVSIKESQMGFGRDNYDIEY